MSPENYIAEQLSKEAQQYNGFNVILLHRYAKKYVGDSFEGRVCNNSKIAYLKLSYYDLVQRMLSIFIFIN